MIVYYGAKVEDLVRMGNYDYANPNITSGSFPSKRRGMQEIEVELVNRGDAQRIEQALRLLDQMGFRPAELRELLVLGVADPRFPDRAFAVVALDVPWESRPIAERIPGIYMHGSKRILNLGTWGGDILLAAVKKRIVSRSS